MTTDDRLDDPFGEYDGGHRSDQTGHGPHPVASAGDDRGERRADDQDGQAAEFGDPHHPGRVPDHREEAEPPPVEGVRRGGVVNDEAGDRQPGEEDRPGDQLTPARRRPGASGVGPGSVLDVTPGLGQDRPANHAAVARSPSSRGTARASGKRLRRVVWSACESRTSPGRGSTCRRATSMPRTAPMRSRGLEQRHPRAERQVHGCRMGHRAAHRVGDHGGDGAHVGEVTGLHSSPWMVTGSPRTAAARNAGTTAA